MDDAHSNLPVVDGAIITNILIFHQGGKIARPVNDKGITP